MVQVIIWVCVGWRLLDVYHYG